MNQVLFPNVGEKITGLLEDLMSYTNYMLEFRGNAKDQVDAIHEASCIACELLLCIFLFNSIRKTGLQEKAY